MDRWLNLKRKSVDSDDEGASSSKQCEPTSLLRKCRRYSKEYLSMGFTCSGPEDKQLPQCVLCYDVLSNEAMKPSKLRRHLETKHKEHITKSIDFFRSKEQELRESKKIVKRSTSGCNNENAVRASFEVSHLISKTGKPHTIAEELVLPAAKIMVSALISEKAAKDLSLIPLSNDTVKKRIVSLSENIKEQLLERVRMSPYFALQLDESTDITNKATLMCYVRYEHLKSVYEDLLFISYLTHTTAEEVFASLNAFIISHNMDWLRCVGVSTDGARAMSGRLTGLAARIKEIAPSATWFHCCLHRDALVVKKIPEELQQTLNESVKIVNFIKNKSLNSRLFEQLCKEMDSEYHQLLLHCEVRWLSRGKVLSRLWELRDEIRLFLLDKQFHLSDRLNDFSWLVKLAYLSDIFIHLNNLNISLQGEKVTVFLVEDKIEAMIKKLELWRQRILNGKYEETFPNFSNFLRSTEEELSENDKSLFAQHLKHLQQSFREYFPVPDASKNWIRDPFSVSVHEVEGLTEAEEDQLMEVTTDGALKMQFKEKTLANFWAYLQDEFPGLSKKAMKVLMPFVTTYLCEKSFSALIYLKNKYRNRLENVESELRIQVSTIKPDISRLVSEMQHHPSHRK